MENLKDLTDKIKKYFELAELHDKQIEDWIKETRKPCHSIINQSAIYRAITSKNSIENTSFEKLSRFRESLLDNILESLEEELVYLEEVRDKIDASNEKIYLEQKSINSLFDKLREKNGHKGPELNPCTPSLEHIISWSYDIWCYYHSLYLQLSQAIVSLDFGEEISVTALLESLKPDPDLKERVKRIQSYNLAHFYFFN